MTSTADKRKIDPMTTEAPRNDEDLYAYVLVRTDLPSLGRGKGYAHSMHAGNQMTWMLAAEPASRGQKVDPRVVQWHDQGGGFGTTAAIGNRDQIDLATLRDVVSAAIKLGHHASLVEDKSYPYEVDPEIHALISKDVHTRPADRTANGWRCYRREITTGWIFGNKRDLAVILRRFGLVAND